MVNVWYMDESDADQRLDHHKSPKHFLSTQQLLELTGVEYFKVGFYITLYSRKF